MAWLASGVVYSLVYLAGGWFLRGHSALLLYFRIAALLVPPMTGVGVIARRRHQWSGCQWLFWATMALGLMMSAIGLVGWTVDDLLLERGASWLGWYAVFTLFGGVAPLFALLAQPHRGPREELTATTAVDIAGIAVLTGFLYSHFVVSPDLSPITAQRPSFALIVLCEFQQLIVCAGMTAAAFVARGLPWGRTYQRLAIGLFVNLVILSITNAEIWQGMYRPGFVYDVIWIMPFAFFPWAAATAPASEDSSPESVETTEVSRPWIVFGALCLVPVLDFGLRVALPLGALDGFRDLFMVITIFSVLPLMLARLAVERGDARQADGKRRLLAAATEQANDLISIVSPDGRIEHANSAFCRALGYSLLEIVRTTTTRFLADESQAHTAVVAETIERDGVWRGTIVRRRKDASTFPSSSTVVALSDEHGCITHLVAVERDVTNETQLGDQRERSEAELRRAKEAAEMANRAKSEFLANMSHEIRTPMNGVIGMTDLVLDTELTSEQREYLRIIKSSADALLTVINDILDVSRMEAGKCELDPIDFNPRDAIGDAANTVAMRAHEKGLELIVDVSAAVPDMVKGDPGRLRQILVNLLGNAIKFTRQGEVVLRVTSDAATSHDVVLHFSVRDTGVGIPLDRQQNIFEAFTQADGSVTRTYGGTGLGLTISSQLVQLMGGRLLVESETGKGSTFHFTASFARVNPPAMAATPEAVNLRDLRVLVIDDNATNRRLLEEMLIGWRMVPTLAAGVAEALAALRVALESGRPFRLVLTDVQMPSGDGFTLAEAIKKDPATAGATVVMLTSAGQPGDAARCRELGVAAYLTKPIKRSELRGAILVALGGQDAERDRPALVTRHSLREARQTGRILLVEDNRVNQLVARRLLEKRGHTVVVANNGREALAILDEAASGGFGCVLMDVQMPEMDGFECTAIIRNKEQLTGSRLPIIAMTAHAMTGDDARCLAAGMDAYLSKPIESDALFDVIDRYLRISSVPVSRPTLSLGKFALDEF